MDTPRDPRNPAGDPLLDPRLARFAERSAAHRNATQNMTRTHGAPPPPPPPGQRASRPPAPTARTARPRRHHAAQGSRALALGLSIGSTLGLTGWMYAAQAADQASTTSATSSDAGSATAATTAETTNDAITAETVESETAADASDTATGTDSTSETTTAETTTAEATTSTTGLADGTYTGDTFSNRWGDVQVQITVEGGVITDVAALQVPTGDHESDEINDQAVPYLESEALAAQSADIDTVSGATYTSEGYRQSLQTAIDDARAAATAS